MKTIEIAAQAMQGDLQRLAQIGQNLANVQTAGYKRVVNAQRPFTLEMQAAEMQAAETRAAAPQADQTIDMTPGALRATGNPMDVAIDGEGFFAVETAQGPALTRQLSLHLDAQGALVNAAGLSVWGDRGALRAGAAGAALRIDARGELWADGRSIGRLQVLRVPDSAALQPLGGGLYRAGDGGLGDAAPGAKVVVGYQEASNVNSSSEMVSLMETSRHFEALARTVQGYDEAMEKAIRKLGDL